MRNHQIVEERTTFSNGVEPGNLLPTPLSKVKEDDIPYYLPTTQDGSVYARKLLWYMYYQFFFNSCGMLIYIYDKGLQWFLFHNIFQCLFSLSMFYLHHHWFSGCNDIKHQRFISLSSN